MTNERSLALIHFTLALMIPAMVALVGGCQRPEDKPMDYGPEVSPAEIEEALLTPISKLNPLEIKVGQFVHFVDTQEIEAQARSIMRETGQTIINRVETDADVTLTMVEQVITYSEGQLPQKVVREKPLVITKATEPSQFSPAWMESSAKFTLERLASIIDMFEVSPRAETATERVTYHNLEHRVVRVAVPDGVKKRAECLGFTDCEVEVTQVAFDQVSWNSETSGDKVHFEYTLSSEVPYLASMMNKCIATLYPTGSQKVLVRQCSPVEDFRFVE